MTDTGMRPRKTRCIFSPSRKLCPKWVQCAVLYYISNYNCNGSVCGCVYFCLRIYITQNIKTLNSIKT